MSLDLSPVHRALIAAHTISSPVNCLWRILIVSLHRKRPWCKWHTPVELRTDSGDLSEISGIEVTGSKSDDCIFTLQSCSLAADCIRSFYRCSRRSYECCSAFICRVPGMFATLSKRIPYANFRANSTPPPASGTYHSDLNGRRLCCSYPTTTSPKLPLSAHTQTYPTSQRPSSSISAQPQPNTENYTEKSRGNCSNFLSMTTLLCCEFVLKFSFID